MGQTKRWRGCSVEDAAEAERLPGLRARVAALRCKFPQLSIAAIARILRVPEDWIEPCIRRTNDAIPHVEAALNCAGRHRASAALALTAIEGDDFPCLRRATRPSRLFIRAGSALIHLLSRASDSLVYDLHIVSRPSLDIRKGESQIEVTFESTPSAIAGAGN